MKPEEIRKLIATLSDLEKSVEKAARSFEQIHADLQTIVESMPKPAPVDPEERLECVCGWKGKLFEAKRVRQAAHLTWYYCPNCEDFLIQKEN